MTGQQPDFTQVLGFIVDSFSSARTMHMKPALRAPIATHASKPVVTAKTSIEKSKTNRSGAWPSVKCNPRSKSISIERYQRSILIVPLPSTRT